MRSVVKTLTNSQINQKYNLQPQVRNRINIAGATIRNESGCFDFEYISPVINIIICVFQRNFENIDFIFLLSCELFEFQNKIKSLLA